mgnify:CR=1 FL=1
MLDLLHHSIDDSDEAENWRNIADIEPSIWKEMNGQRWAVRHHYTCSYMAMFPPELPHYFIHKFTDVDDVVLDPFCGRGTTVVQAMSQLRFGIGNDYNELAFALSNGKISNPSKIKVIARLKTLEAAYEREKEHYLKQTKDVDSKIRMIYHDNTLAQLLFMKEQLKWRPELRSDTHDSDRFITMILMGAMHGSSSGFLSVSMPNTFSMGWKYVENYIAKHNLISPERDVFKVVRERCERTLKDGRMEGGGWVTNGDSKSKFTFKRRKDKTIKPGMVDLVFSSPPYLKVIKYGLYNWIRLWFLLESGNHVEIDEKLDDGHSLPNYLKFMEEVLSNIAPLMNPDTGVACWVIGDVSRGPKAPPIELANEVAMHATTIDVRNSRGEKTSYRVLDIIEDRIDDESKVTKIWNSSDSDENRSGKATNLDRILILCLESADLEAIKRKMTGNKDIQWTHPIIRRE